MPFDLMNDQLLTACQSEDPQQIAAAMVGCDFWLVNISEPGQADTSALVVDLEGLSALVAFTSEDHAGTYAEATNNSLNKDDELPCFVVGGKELISSLTKKLGLVLNPETEHGFFFAPDFARQIKSSCS